MVFCLRCDEQVELAADPSSHALRCPACGEARRLPRLPLFVVTGASGTGKTTIVDALTARLSHCEVLETDLILHVAELG